LVSTDGSASSKYLKFHEGHDLPETSLVDGMKNVRFYLLK